MRDEVGDTNGVRMSRIWRQVWRDGIRTVV